MSIQRCCPSTPLEHTNYSDEAALLRAVSDSTRLAILGALSRAGDHVCVCDFTAGLPLNQPTVSHHLKILREAALVTCERHGTWVYYRLASDARRRLSAVLERVFTVHEEMESESSDSDRACCPD